MRPNHHYQIYKYSVDFTQRIFCLSIHEGARILDLQLQTINKIETPIIWVLEDILTPKEKWSFAIYGTGWSVNESDADRYLGTWQIDSFVWHLFGGPEREREKEKEEEEE